MDYQEAQKWLQIFNQAKEDKQEAIKSKNIEQIRPESIYDSTAASNEELNAHFRRGLEAISLGGVAALVLAGGQATRLGADMPKGIYPLGICPNNPDTDTLFYILIARLRRLLDLAKAAFPDSKPSIPFVVMTSVYTDADTRQHLAKVIKALNFPYSDLIYIQQAQVPVLDENGAFLQQTADKIAKSPNGNGGIYEAISPIMEELQLRYVKYFHIFSVDNVLNRIADPSLIGKMIEFGADCVAKVVEKVDSFEAVGNLCLQNGRPHVLEYSEISHDLAECRDKNGRLYLHLGSIANHAFSMNFMRNMVNEKASDLRYHLAHKKVRYWDPVEKKIVNPTAPNAYKLELFIFDAFAYSEKFLAYMVNKTAEFCPLKSPADLPACRKALAEIDKATHAYL